MPDNDESFLNRWARRKAAVREESTRDGKPDQEAAPGAADAAHLQSDGGQDTVAKSDTGEAEAAEAAPGEETAAAEPVETFDDVDFDALDYDSDYARFMGSKVPDDVRNKALRKLWMSNPVLTHMDGLDDYIEDYTDAAVAVPMGLLKTGYKVGQGFLSNEEAAEWDALGRPEPVAGAEPPTEGEPLA